MRFEVSGRVRGLASYVVRSSELGAWCAELTLPAASDLVPGPCVLGGWAGTIRSVRQTGGLAYLDVRAGDDALDRPTTARQWAATLPADAVASLLASEAGTRATAPGQVATWRAFGGTLRDEIARLARWLASGSWYVDEATGVVTVGARSSAALDAPGRLAAEGPHWLAYDLQPDATALPVLVGHAVGSVDRVDRAIYQWTGSGPPTVDLFGPPPSPAIPPGTIVGGTVQDDTEDRASIVLDSGVELADVPLWFLPGVRCSVARGTRVLVCDLGGDPRAPIAFAAPFDSAPASDLGVALRVGDVIMFPIGATPASAVPTPLPIQLGPGITQPGPPGAGTSRIKL